jgi:FMN phosphatase YigB (HAD superfamily)
VFEVACDELGVVPAETLMVGNNPLTDGGAIHAGLPTYILPAAVDGSARGLDAVLTLMETSPSA